MASRVTLAAAFLLAVAVLPAHATVLRHSDLHELVSGSSDIVVGQVESVAPRWNASGTKIVTEVTVRVSESLKGGNTERITLTQLGGTVGNARYTVPGSPVFSPGEQALLFVWRDAQGRAQVNGLGQGKFDIAVDPASGARTVQRVSGLAVSDVRTLSMVKPGEMTPRIPLDTMLREIRRQLEEGGR